MMNIVIKVYYKECNAPLNYENFIQWLLDNVSDEIVDPGATKLWDGMLVNAVDTLLMVMTNYLVDQTVLWKVKEMTSGKKVSGKEQTFRLFMEHPDVCKGMMDYDTLRQYVQVDELLKMVD